MSVYLIAILMIINRTLMNREARIHTDIGCRTDGTLYTSQANTKSATVLSLELQYPNYCFLITYSADVFNKVRYSRYNI